MQWLIGVDEAGRGPLAGPVAVGACLIRARDARRVLLAVRGVRDCKQLSPEKRLAWASRIRALGRRRALQAATALVSERVIDRRGISAALRMGIARTLRKLSVSPTHSFVMLDGGIRAPARYLFQETILGGDEKEPLIALASILAKVRRDRHMVRLSKRFPAYGFEKHKGYGTKKHYAALRKHGLSPVHRRSFLKNFLNQ